MQTLTLLIKVANIRSLLKYVILAINILETLKNISFVFIMSKCGNQGLNKVVLTVIKESGV